MLFGMDGVGEAKGKSGRGTTGAGGTLGGVGLRELTAGLLRGLRVLKGSTGFFFCTSISCGRIWGTLTVGCWGGETSKKIKELVS